MTTPNVRHVSIGSHRVEFEDGLATLRWIGHPSYEDCSGIFGQLAAELPGHEWYYIIADMRQSGIPDARSRRYCTEWIADHAVGALAAFGANLAIRSIMTLLVNAMRVMDRTMPPVKFFAAETEARAWIAAERSRKKTITL